MGFFDIFSSKPKAQPKSNKPNKPNKPMRIYRFTNTKGFRGFKWSALSSHYGEAPQNLFMFWHQDISTAEIVFEENRTTDGRPMLNVFLAGKLIAHVWKDTNTYDRIINNQVEAVYLEIEDETVLTSEGSLIRPRPRLFVKLKEA